jgi:hypothetical protein
MRPRGGGGAPAAGQGAGGNERIRFSRIEYLRSTTCEGIIMIKSLVAISVAALFAVVSDAATLTADPITGLPLDPATNSRLNLGNEPTQLPISNLCKSKVSAEFYTVYESFHETVAWYTAHLKELKHAHGYSGGRSRDTFYNSAGTIMVTITADPGADGQNVDTHSVAYYKMQPGLSEKTILGSLSEKLTCN